jgi:ActR/RegA family two-component response regulator/glycine cleavage system H lipoate-binding protein
MTDKMKILVVDDELPVARSVAAALAGDRYGIDTALSAEEALRKEEANPHDVIITDLMMPGLSGMALLKKLKEKRPSVRVIMITGYPSVKSAVEAIKIGAFDYVPKPFTPDDLRSVVARAVENLSLEKRKEAAPEEDRRPSAPPGLLFIPGNSWAGIEDPQRVRMGAHHAFVRAIGEIRKIELPEEGEARYQGEAFARITGSEERVHRVWTPLGGRIVAVNRNVLETPAMLSADPYHDGWLVVVTPTNLEGDKKVLLPGTGA